MPKAQVMGQGTFLIHKKLQQTQGWDMCSFTPEGEGPGAMALADTLRDTGDTQVWVCTLLLSPATAALRNSDLRDMCFRQSPFSGLQTTLTKQKAIRQSTNRTEHQLPGA